jgi:hypothetical protein
MNLPEGTHLAFFDYRGAWYASGVREQMIGISASAGPGSGGAWGFEVAEVDLGEHGTALQVRVFEDAFDAFTQVPEFFSELALVPDLTLDGVIFLLRELGAADETVTDPPVTAEASPVEKAAAVIRNHPYGTRDQGASRALAAAILSAAAEP